MNYKGRVLPFLIGNADRLEVRWSERLGRRSAVLMYPWSHYCHCILVRQCAVFCWGILVKWREKFGSVS